MKTKLFLYFAMMLMWQNAFAISNSSAIRTVVEFLLLQL